jgi:hypothetical protein
MDEREAPFYETPSCSCRMDEREAPYYKKFKL